MSETIQKNIVKSTTIGRHNTEEFVERINELAQQGYSILPSSYRHTRSMVSATLVKTGNDENPSEPIKLVEKKGTGAFVAELNRFLNIGYMILQGTFSMQNDDRRNAWVYSILLVDVRGDNKAPKCVIISGPTEEVDGKLSEFLTKGYLLTPNCARSEDMNHSAMLLYDTPDQVQHQGGTVIDFNKGKPKQ